VRVKTLKLVHDGTDVLDTVGKLNLHGLFDNTYQSVAMLHGSQIVQTVGKSQSLWICHTLPHLLDGTMDVAKVWIDALYDLSVEHSLQTEYTVGSRVLRADVEHIVIIAKQLILLALQFAIVVEIVLQTVVGLYIVLEGVLIVKLPILAERIALEVIAQEQATHVGMTYEYDSEEVVNLALQQIGHLPDIRHSRDIRCILLSLSQLLHAATLVSFSIFKDIDTAESLFSSEVLAYDGDKIVKALLVLQVLHLLCKLVKIK
jgi:hypothetical protein